MIARPFRPIAVGTQVSVLYSERQNSGVTAVGWESSRFGGTLTSSSGVTFATPDTASLRRFLGVCSSECGEAKTVVGATVCTLRV